MKRLAAYIALSTIAFVVPSNAQTATTAPTASTASGPVAVVVSFPMRPGMTRADVDALIAKYTPYYQSQIGLKQKYFTVDEKTHRMGGIYLWTSVATAKAFYSDAWRTQVVSAFGAPPEMIWYDVPSVIQGKAGMP